MSKTIEKIFMRAIETNNIKILKYEAKIRQLKEENKKMKEKLEEIKEEK